MRSAGLIMSNVLLFGLPNVLPRSIRHYAARFGIGLSTNRKNRVLCVPDLTLISGPGLLPSAFHEIYIAISITYEFAVLF
jgi:hypothetical protein